MKESKGSNGWTDIPCSWIEDSIVLRSHSATTWGIDFIQSQSRSQQAVLWMSTSWFQSLHEEGKNQVPCCLPCPQTAGTQPWGASHLCCCKGVHKGGTEQQLRGWHWGPGTCELLRGGSVWLTGVTNNVPLRWKDNFVILYPSSHALLTPPNGQKLCPLFKWNILKLIHKSYLFVCVAVTSFLKHILTTCFAYILWVKMKWMNQMLMFMLYSTVCKEKLANMQHIIVDGCSHTSAKTYVWFVSMS